MYTEYEISKELKELSEKTQYDIEPIFRKINKICEINSLKVLKAFQKYQVSEMHFGTSTGYGYGDIGRDVIEKVFSEVLDTEDSLVRNQFISGTHALTVALFGLLRPGDTMLSINGKPYDTLDEIIGIKENKSSLKAYGINYDQIDLIGNEFDTEEIIKHLQNKKIKLIEIQRSRGYALRKSLSLEKIENIIKEIRKIDKNVIIMVDNCYGEFVDIKEPTS